jgi:hypothetical protein
MLSSCIKPYFPAIDAGAGSKYVVSGRVSDVEGWQEVEVSLSSPINAPEYIPVAGCQISILDDKGSVFPLVEYQPGKYHVWIGQEYLVHGTSYKVTVTTPDGQELASEFDPMPSGPPLDSVYYAIKDMPTSDPGTSLRVMQFYVDVNAAAGNFSRFYKWDVEETWEYHAAQRIQYYYDGHVEQVSPPDYSKFTCWKTRLVKNVFTLSTKNLSQNIYTQYPLHSIDGQTSRLSIMYSILVKQLALSEGAYNYWEQLRINSNEQGGLYEKQPLAVKGNITNLSKPEIDVLGYFYTSSESSRRYFYHDVEGIELDFDNGCHEYALGMGGFSNIYTWEYPAYFYYSQEGIKTLDIECVDCRKLGGKTEKPDFWPN